VRKPLQGWPEDASWPAWATPGAAGPRVEPIASADAEVWLRWVIPLPKRVRFQGRLKLAAGDVALRARRNATDVERTAVRESAELILTRTRAGELRGPFSILIGVCDPQGTVDGISVPGAAELARLPNADQAYVIAPLPEPGIAVAALTERGVYHGVKTLQHFLEAHLAPGQIMLPVVAVLDWPDLAERGQWGGSCVRDIEYLADRKMDLVEVHAKLSFDERGRGVATLDAKRQEDARLHAVKWVPIVTHLDQIAGSGIYQRYPELKGKGKKAQSSWGPEVFAPCFSQPKMPEILADWFVSLAATPGVEDICVWLSEDHVQCECEGCQAKGQFALEAEACVRAWKLARQRNPKVRLRILLTQGSYATNDKVLDAAAEAPEVGITYYDGGRTYDSSRDPMIYPLLAEAARKGRWLGCYPQLTASWRIVCPWSGPQFVRFRMGEFADKGLQCLCGYATPDNRFYDFNVTAAAEWSWNAHGRTEREFALAWATRRRLGDPEKAAEWATMLGPVGWDVYGSGIPYPQFFGRTADLIRKRARPELGQGMFRYFPTPEHTDNALAICGRALGLAQELRDPAILAETRTIQGYVQMVKAIHAIAITVAGRQKLEPAEAERVQAAFDALVAAGTEVTRGLQAWRAAVAPDSTASRFLDTVSVTDQAVSAVGAALEPLGIQDKEKPYRPAKVGAWQTADLDEREDIQKQWDVTGAIVGEGTYTVRFAYTRGWWGLNIRRVALVAARKGAPDERTEVAADQHDGVAANEDKANTYTLKLPTHDPAARYLVTAEIRGVTSKGKPPDRRGCEGEVWFAKERPGPPK